MIKAANTTADWILAIDPTVVFSNVVHEEQSCSQHGSDSELVASGSTPAFRADCDTKKYQVDSNCSRGEQNDEKSLQSSGFLVFASEVTQMLITQLLLL